MLFHVGKLPVALCVLCYSVQNAADLNKVLSQSLGVLGKVDLIGCSPVMSIKLDPPL